MTDKDFNRVMGWLAGHKKAALHQRTAYSQVGAPHQAYPGMEEAYAKAARECEIIDLIIGGLTPPPPAKTGKLSRALDFFNDAFGLALLCWAAIGLGALTAVGVALTAAALHVSPIIVSGSAALAAMGVTLWRRRRKGRK